MSPVLQRVTTEFIAEEDRMRLSGLTEDGHKVVLWLTRRMFALLMPVLLKQLDAQFDMQPEAHRDALQEFAQQAARGALERSEPVSAGAQAASVLVIAVDVGQMEGGILLNFRDADEAAYRLPLAGEALRQWLHILYQLDSQAHWQASHWQWPAWLTGEPAADPTPSMALH